MLIRTLTLTRTLTLIRSPLPLTSSRQGAEKPAFITLYFEGVDTQGHLFGPTNNSNVAKAVKDVRLTPNPKPRPYPPVFTDISLNLHRTFFSQPNLESWTGGEVPVTPFALIHTRSP